MDNQSRFYPLETLTPAKVQTWKVDALKRVGPVAVNTTLESAKAHFSQDRVKYLGFSVTNPFAGVKLAKKPSQSNQPRNTYPGSTGLVATRAVEVLLTGRTGWIKTW
jgi:hypothetical protein